MISKALRRTYQQLRKTKYRLLSQNRHVQGKPIRLQPVLYLGEGNIEFENNVTLGYFPSPFFYNGLIYLEARRKTAKIKFGKNVFVNNNLTVICEASTIEIGNEVLIGTNVEIIDSDFHEVHPQRRNSGQHKAKPVKIENNAFIGSNVKIMKGVTVGENSIVSNGAVVMQDVPKNVIVAGNPASVIRTLSYE